MSRPVKSINLTSKHNTKEDIAIRKSTEERLRGGSEKLRPPSYLTTSQRKIFKYIVSHLEEAGILGNMDIYILSMGAVTIDNLIAIDTNLNQIDMMKESTSYKALVASRSMLTKDFYRLCNELSLSPQARAKLSVSATKAVKECKNPLLVALEDL